jgi:wobble nucleotide-excising tRNase
LFTNFTTSPRKKSKSWTRVTKIKDCPSFVEFRSGTDLPEFKKYNLIYGWNGSGKTSFSRVLRSFELGENYYKHPERVPEFEFKLKNGKSIDQNGLTAFPNIKVFNKDFIEDSVFGTSGPKPIFFLGLMRDRHFLLLIM